MVEHDSQKKKEDLKNTRELVAKFEGRINIEIKKQKKLDITEEKNFKRGKLLEKYITKMLYRWDNGKFENKYLRRLERNWKKQKKENKIREKDKPTSFFRSKNLEEEVISDIQSLNTNFLI